MSCAHRFATTLAIILGMAGTAMGIYACVKISEITRQAP